MTEKLIRWFTIIYAIQAKPGISVKELAQKCEANERTIYRDLLTLSAITPITNEGYGKGYTFMGDFAVYPLNWTEQEALVFSLLPSVVDTSRLPPGFESAYDKVMAARVRQRARDREILQHVTDIIQMGTPAYREDAPNFLLEVIQATLQERTLETVYHTQSRNEETRRLIDPYYLVPRDQRFYLIGYCHLAGEVRTFRLSRFRQVRTTEQYFDKGGFNIKQYLKNTWSIERGEGEIKFKVRFDADAARYVQEEEMFVRPRMTPQKDGSLLFEVTVNQEREFLAWLAQYGPSAEILEPQAYRARMREQLEKWLGRYV